MATEEVGVRLSVKGRREAAKALRDTAQDIEKVESKLDRASRSGTRFGVVAGQKIVGAARMGGRALVGLAKGAGLAGAALVALGVTAGRRVLDLGVRLEAMGNKSATVFGDQLGVVQKWAKANANSMGLTGMEATSLAANFADLLIPMGFARDKAAKLSTDVIGLAGALSQWSGGTRSAAEVADILSAAMLGETDSLKGLGIAISAADIDARLAAKGQKELTGALGEQAKAMAISEIIFEKSEDAQAAYADGTNKLGMAQARVTAKLKELRDRGVMALMPHMLTLAEKVERLGVEFENGTGTGGRLRDKLDELRAIGVRLWEEFRTGTGTGGDLRASLETAGAAAVILGTAARDYVLPALRWLGENPDVLKGVVAGMVALKIATAGAAVAQLALNAAQLAGLGKGTAAATAATTGSRASRLTGAAGTVARRATPVAVGVAAYEGLTQGELQPWVNADGRIMNPSLGDPVNPNYTPPTPRAPLPMPELFPAVPPPSGNRSRSSVGSQDLHLYIDGKEVLTTVEERAFAREARR